jgi:hypothetical protein
VFLLFFEGFQEKGLLICHRGSILVPERSPSNILKPLKSKSMRRRVRKIVNFFAFNLLFFALYLNFIHKDNTVTVLAPSQVSAATVDGTVPVQNQEQYLNVKNAETNVQTGKISSTQKLAIN